MPAYAPGNPRASQNSWELIRGGLRGWEGGDVQCREVQVIGNTGYLAARCSAAGLDIPQQETGSAARVLACRPPSRRRKRRASRFGPVRLRCRSGASRAYAAQCNSNPAGNQPRRRVRREACDTPRRKSEFGEAEGVGGGKAFLEVPGEEVGCTEKGSNYSENYSAKPLCRKPSFSCKDFADDGPMQNFISRVSIWKGRQMYTSGWDPKPRRGYPPPGSGGREKSS